MLRRLFLAVLALCLTLPALVMPAGHALAQSPNVAAKSAHDCHKPAKQAPMRDHGQQHECIGCIARYDGIAPAACAAEPAEALPAMPLAVQLPQTRAGPDTPPPKA